MHMGARRHNPSLVSERDDQRRGVLAAVLFSISLGAANVIVPLLAVASGYSPVAVGILVALSAVTQVAARIAMGPLLRRLRDRTLIAAAAILIGLSCGVLLLSTSLMFFALSLFMQGGARALFWTGSQIHAVRGSGTSVSAIQRLNVASGIGSLIGPALAGFVAAHSLSTSLLVSFAIGILAAVPAAFLHPFAPFTPVPADEHGGKPVKLWRRKGVIFGSWMGVTAGSWKAIMNSYVPVLLAAVGTSVPMIGIIVSAANVATLAGNAVATWARSLGGQKSILLGVLPTGIGLAAFGVVPDHFIGAMLFLALSGIGAGILQTVGPALAADWARPEERGSAIASVGTSRAAALLVAPLAMAGLILVLPIGAALTVGGCVISIPAVLALWKKPGLGEHLSH